MNPTLQRIITTPQGIVKNGLVAWYKFDNTGQILFDYKDGFHHRNGSDVGVDAADATPGAQGWTFATDDYTYLAGTSAGILDTIADELSMVLVFKLSAIGVAQDVFGRQATTSDMIEIMADNKFRFNLLLSGGAASLVSTATAAAETWYCVTATFDSTKGMNIYRGITNIATNTTTGTLANVGGVKPWSFGVVVAGRFLFGTIAYGLVYNAELTPANISQNLKALKPLMAKRGITLAS